MLRPIRVLLAVLAALSLLAAACSGDDESTDAGDTETTDTTEVDAETTETTAAPAETTVADTEAETTVADTTAETDAGSADDEAAAGGGDAATIGVELGEWFVELSSDVPVGTVSFELENVGENPHAFAIVRGDAYENLPQKTNGAVDTDAMPAEDVIGNTDNIESGGSGQIEFDLEPGDYVFFCPIEFGPNSHAAAGQVLSVTIAG